MQHAAGKRADDLGENQEVWIYESAAFISCVIARRVTTAVTILMIPILMSLDSRFLHVMLIKDNQSLALSTPSQST